LEFTTEAQGGFAANQESKGKNGGLVTVGWASTPAVGLQADLVFAAREESGE
jgi:hypothetical protein